MKNYETIFTLKNEYVFNKGFCKSKIYIENDNYHGVNYNYGFNIYSNKSCQEISFYWFDQLLS